MALQRNQHVEDNNAADVARSVPASSKLRHLIFRWGMLSPRTITCSHGDYTQYFRFYRQTPSPQAKEQGAPSVDEREKLPIPEARNYGTIDARQCGLSKSWTAKYFSYYSFPPIAEAEDGIDPRHDGMRVRYRRRSDIVPSVRVLLCHLVSMTVLFGLMALVVLCRTMAKGDGGII
jgi:hypothetical protein